MKNFFLRFAIALVALFAIGLSVQAQNRSLETYAITNARIVSVTGATTKRGTVVVRNGLIESSAKTLRFRLTRQSLTAPG